MRASCAVLRDWRGTALRAGCGCRCARHHTCQRTVRARESWRGAQAHAKGASPSEQRRRNVLQFTGGFVGRRLWGKRFTCTLDLYYCSHAADDRRAAAPTTRERHGAAGDRPAPAKDAPAVPGAGARAMVGPVVGAPGAVAEKLNVLSLPFMPGIGFSLATTAIVGQAAGVGRIDEARGDECGDALGNHLDGRVRGALHSAHAADGRDVQRRSTVDRKSAQRQCRLSRWLNRCGHALWWWVALYVALATRACRWSSSSILGWAAVGIELLPVSIWPALWAVWPAYITGPPKIGTLWRVWRRKARGSEG